jgi:hypothetical protein
MTLPILLHITDEQFDIKLNQSLHSILCSFFSEFFYFKNIYQHSAIKLVLLGYFCLTCIATTPFYFLIIRFEKNCQYRTLINQMLSSAMYTPITHNIVFMPLTVFVYLASPIDSPVFCKIYLIIFNMCAHHCLMLLDGMLIVKVLLKNTNLILQFFYKLSKT